MPESVYGAASKSAVRKDMWVRIPPAAPSLSSDRPQCRARPPDPISCIDERALGPSYVYLLGLYLGDGSLSQAARDVWRLRISMDSRYPGIIEECVRATREVTGGRVGLVPRVGCHDISSYWKHWLCAFPQHGPGPKHLRRIELEAWQRYLVEPHAAELVRGLVHSDGCRVINRVKRYEPPRVKHYEYPRYFFSNRSPELRNLFISACGSIGVEARPNNRYSISVARRGSVEILDRFIGPKR